MNIFLQTEKILSLNEIPCAAPASEQRQFNIYCEVNKSCMQYMHGIFQNCIRKYLIYDA